jgi:hypothetical protein
VAKHVALESRHHDIAEFLEAHEPASVNVDEFANEESCDENDENDETHEALEEAEVVPGHVGDIDLPLTM